MLSARQHALTRAQLCRKLASNSAALANPSDADFLGLFAQLFSDASGAPALSAPKLDAMSAALRGLLATNSPDVANVSSDGVFDFVTRLAVDSANSAALSTARYGAFRSVLRDLLSTNPQGASNPTDADVLGFFGSFGLPVSTWAQGLYVDTIADAVGGSVGSIAGAGLFGLVPSPTPPKVFANAVRGNPGVFYQNDGSPYRYMSANQAAALVRNSAGSWTICGEGRLDKSGEQPICSALRSDGASTEQWFLRTLGNTFVFRKTVGGVTTSLPATVSAAPCDDTMWALVCNAGALTFYERGFDQVTEVVSVLGTVPGASLSSAVDRFTFGASVSSVPFEGFSGYQTKFAICPTALAAANIRTLFDTWQRSGALTTGPSGIRAIEPGDSIMGEVQDIYTVSGMGNIFGELWGTNGCSIFPRGGTESGGTGLRGPARLVQSSWNSGQTISQIGTQALIDIAANGGLPRSRFWLCYMGGGDNNALTPPATIVATFVQYFTAAMDAAIAQDSNFFVACSKGLIPNQDASIQANLVALYPLLTAALLLLQPKYPGRIYLADWYQAAGRIWTSAVFGSDSGHMLRAGCILCALDPVYGSINSKNERGETLAARFFRESPTLNRPALSVTLTAPTNGSTFAHGATITVACDLSRIGGTPTVVTDGNARGVMSPVDIYDFINFSGSYLKVPHISWTFALPTAASDVGTHSMRVDFLDCDGVTTASSQTVSYTIT